MNKEKIIKERTKNDVLNALANLSNDEIFSSSKFANLMLDRLDKSIWKNKDTKIEFKQSPMAEERRVAICYK